VTVTKTLILLTLSSFLLGQSAWNTGDLSFTYQRFPTPAQSLDLSGDLFSDEIPHEGVGGFELALGGDTNIVTLLAYDLYESGTDTLADIFVIFMSDTLPLDEGDYIVNPSPEALKMFVWLSEVNPENLAGIIDASFTLDSLAAFNPYISVSGNFEIIASSPFHFELRFSGAMVNTSFQLLSITNGNFSLWNTLPISVYTGGSMNYSAGDETGSINGALNPLIEPEGAGALRTQQGDTLTYNFISYLEQADNLYDVYGVVLTGNDSHFPINGSESQFNISLFDNSLPQAIPYMMQDVALDEIVALLESGELPGLDQLSQLYLPVGGGSAVFAYTAAGDAQLLAENVLMSNSTADVTQLSMDWLLTNSLPSEIRDEMIFNPNSTNIVGKAYPNPFNSSTIVPVHLIEGTDLRLRIYNIMGQEVYHSDYGLRGPGNHALILDLGQTNLGAGPYYYSLFTPRGPLGSGSVVYLR
jgi:hypothetical protein